MTTDYSLHKKNGGVSRLLNDIISESLKETITETLKEVGKQISAATIAILVGIIVKKGADAAHTWLKNEHNIDIDKSVFEDAIKSANRRA